MAPDLHLEPWSDADLDIEVRANSPEMTARLSPATRSSRGTGGSSTCG